MVHADDGNGHASGNITDALGGYTVEGLPTGDYRVQFHPLPGTDLVVEYYDDATSHEQATLVAVTVGETVEGIDAVLTEGGPSVSPPGTPTAVSAVPADAQRRDRAGPPPTTEVHRSPRMS